MSARALGFVAGLYLACAASGCAFVTRYDVRVLEPQKDVVLLVICVPDRLGADAYRGIAEEEIRKLLASRRGSRVPIYEVQVEFLSPPDERGNELKLASFSWKNGSGSVDLESLPEHALVLY